MSVFLTPLFFFQKCGQEIFFNCRMAWKKAKFYGAKGSVCVLKVAIASFFFIQKKLNSIIIFFIDFHIITFSSHNKSSMIFFSNNI